MLTGGTGGVANFSGMITGIGGITVNGTGTVNLSGANTYLGGTTCYRWSLIASVSGGLCPPASRVDASTTATSIICRQRSIGG